LRGEVWEKAVTCFDQALEHLTTATAMYGEMGMRFRLEQTQTELMGQERGV